MCVYRLRYTARNGHGPYRHSLYASYKVISKLFHSGTILEIKLPSEICVLILSETFVQIISHCKKERATYDKNVFRSSPNGLLSKSDYNEI